MIVGRINKIIRAGCFLLLPVLLPAITGCGSKSQPQEFITLGALLPLCGEDADEGLRAYNGLMLAKEEINRAGGILGKMLDIIVLNDFGNEEYVVQQYNVLMEKNVAAIIGSSYSDVTMALAEAAEKDGIPVISPSASSPGITQGRKNIFRAIFIDDYQAEVMAYFAHDSLNAQTAVVLENAHADNFMQTARAFCDAFRNYGGSIIAVESYSNESEFARILGKYAGSSFPDVFYCSESFTPAVALVNTAYDLGFTDTPILGSDSWDGILTYLIHPEAMKNVYYTSPFLFDDQDDDVKRFVRDYFRGFSQMPLSGSATAYTCVYILAEAIRKAGNTSPDSIISAIKGNELDMITGRILFDENNNPRTNVYIIRIEGGVYSTYKKISL